MTPQQVAFHEGSRGFVLAAAFLLLWVLAKILVPTWNRTFFRSRQGHTVSLAWLWLVAASVFRAGSLYLAGAERYGLAWACWAMSIACWLGMAATIAWRVLARPAVQGNDGPS